MIKYFVPMYHTASKVFEWVRQYHTRDQIKRLEVFRSNAWQNTWWWGILYSYRNDVPEDKRDIMVEIRVITDSEVTHSPKPRKIWLKEMY